MIVDSTMSNVFKPVPECWPLIHNKSHGIEWIGNQTRNSPAESSNNKQPSELFRKAFISVFRPEKNNIVCLDDKNLLNLVDIFFRESKKKHV